MLNDVCAKYKDLEYQLPKSILSFRDGISYTFEKLFLMKL
jgi:hypothetical protein